MACTSTPNPPDATGFDTCTLMGKIDPGSVEKRVKTLILTAMMIQGIDAQVLPNPWLNAMEVRGDTAWFYVWPPWGGSPEEVVAFGRSRSEDTSTWVRRAGFSPQPVGHMPGAGLDTVFVDDEYMIVPPRRVDGRVEPTALVSRVDGARFQITADISDETKLALLNPDIRHPTFEPEEIIEYSHGSAMVWARSDRAIWFGLVGGVNEEFVGFGGLLRFDRETRTFSGRWLRELSLVEVSGLAIADGQLWIANRSPGEYGPYPGDGLLTYDLDSGALGRYSWEDSGLPDHILQGVWADSGTIWVSARAGVARLDVSAGSWQSAFHTPDLVGDSVVFNLVESEQPDSARINLFLTMQELGTERRADFYAVASKLERERFLGTAARSFRPVVALQDTAFVPFLLEHLLDRYRQGIASWALRGVPEAGPAVRQALEDATAERAVLIARHLAAVAHLIGLEWIETHLDPATTDSVRLVGAIDALETIGPAEVVRRRIDAASLVALLDDPRYAWPAARALLRFKLLDDWSPIGSWTMRSPEHWTEFLESVGVWRFGASAQGDQLRAITCTVAHRALESDDPPLLRAAATALVFRADPHGFDMMVEKFMSSERDVESVARRLSNVLDLRPPAGTEGDSELSRAFWRDWISRNGPTRLSECERMAL